MKFIFCTVGALLWLALAAGAQTTAFTYQGQLNSNNVPVTGSYDLRFQIYNANNSVVAGPLTNAPVGVTNGLFLVTLDFGTGVFNGTLRSLEIGVRTNGATSAYVVLAPRQALTSVPYAIQSLNASNAVALTSPLQATNMVGTIPNALLSTNVAVLTNNVIFSGNVTAANFTGNGAALTTAGTADQHHQRQRLWPDQRAGHQPGRHHHWQRFRPTNVPGTNLVGTIPDARLSANAALQSNPNLNFAGTVSATNFTGAGSGLTNLPATNLVGTIPDARLSANVALQSNPNLNFAGTVSATNFTGAGSGLTNVPGATLTGTIPDARLTANVALQSNPNLNFAGLVSATNFTGAGHGLTNVPGAFFWITNAVTSYSMQPNMGYIATNGTAPVIFTLPASPMAGDVYKVAGLGAGGWKIMQNANQTVAAGNLSDSVGQSWKPGASSPLNWSAIASSADGTKLVATVNNGYIWTSTNSGATWT